MTPFISSADLEDYLGRAVIADKANIALDSACDSIRKVAEQSLDWKSGDTVLLDSEGSEALLLPELPVYSVTSVEGPGDYPVPFVLDKEMGAVRTKTRGTKFLKGRQIYTVVYTHGYVSDVTPAGIPDDAPLWPSALRLVALQLAARIYDQGIVSSESVGGTSASYSVPEGGLLSPREMDMVEKIVGIGRRR